MRKACMAFLLCCLMGVSFASAADGDWSIWIYTAAIGRLRQFDQDGLLLRELTITLPSDADAGGYPAAVAVSHDGNLLAYVVRSSATDVPTVLVWDVAASAYAATFSLPPGARVSLEFLASPLNFSETDGQIAFSYGLESGGWQVVVLDLTTNDSFVLDSANPAVVSAGVPADPFIVPIVRAYRGASVYFTMLPVPSDAFGGPSFIWDTTSGQITPNVAYTMMGGDTLLMTGEYVTGLNDDRFPYASDPNAFPLIQFNTLQVFDPAVGGLFPVYADAESSVFEPRFVQNGERVAVIGQNADGSDFVGLLERDGTWLGSLAAQVSSLQGLFNGFVYTTGDPLRTTVADSTAVYAIETRAALPADAGRLIWNSPAGEFAQVIWTSDNFAIGPSMPVAWNMLAAPIYPAGAAALAAPPLPSPTPVVFVPPTAAPAASAASLAVGADAIVNTTEGDSLRMRSGPGTEFTVVREIPSGTRVTILEGPRSANGFVWWRIRLADGTSGWSVQAADGVQTLLPVFAG